MYLCLDIGNSNIFVGIYAKDEIIATSRCDTLADNLTSRMLGNFLLGVLTENNIDKIEISSVVVCSVVPSLNAVIKECCNIYFESAYYIETSSLYSGLDFQVELPETIGNDRVACAVGAAFNYPGQNIIVVDLGTATTYCAISADRKYYAGPIVLGLNSSMQALHSSTALLPVVDIIQCSKVIGRNTQDNIQSGLFFGCVSMINGITDQITKELFPGMDVTIVGTGGGSGLFAKHNVFDDISANLVFKGMICLINNSRDHNGHKIVT